MCVGRKFLAERWELRRATPPTPVSPCFLVFYACSQPFSSESSGNPTHMGPHMLSTLCVRVCVCALACECPYVYTVTYRADQWTLVLQRRNSATSTKQEMNELTYGGASRWPSTATKGRARADEFPLQASCWACSCRKGGQVSQGLPSVHMSVHSPPYVHRLCMLSRQCLKLAGSSAA